MSKTIEEAATLHAIKAADTVILKGKMESHYAERARLSFIAGADFALTHQWRSVEDGMPEDDDVVLAEIAETADEHEFIRYTIARYEDGCWIFQDDYFEDCTVTHFMYIPSLNPEQL